MDRETELLAKLYETESEYNKNPTPELKQLMVDVAKELNTLLLKRCDD